MLFRLFQTDCDGDQATAKANIERFHQAGGPPDRKIETTSGVLCWSRTIPIERVGLYVPAGSAPLFSTVLMLAVPAPPCGMPRSDPLFATGRRWPNRSGDALRGGRLCGVDKVFKVGGRRLLPRWRSARRPYRV